MTITAGTLTHGGEQALAMVMQVSARQLHLFRGKRQRGSVPPAPTEFASQCVLVDIVRRWLNPMALHPHAARRISRSGDRVPVAAARHHARLAGSAIRRTKSADGFLELKRRGGRLSEPQAAMRDHVQACGFNYLCTDSVEVAIAWLKQHGILRGGFTA